MQLGDFNDVLLSDAMEIWGKVIAGLGLGLLLTRYFITKEAKVLNSQGYKVNNIRTYFVFIVVCLITIPTSFVLQGLLIRTVVNSASEEDKNKAVLVVATHGTLVPFYNIDNKHQKIEPSLKESLLFSFYEDGRFKGDSYAADVSNELAMTELCAAKTSESMGITSKLEKAFFPYVSLLKDISEDSYKQVITDYYSCAFENRDYLKARLPTDGIETQFLYDAYEDLFLPATGQYYGYKKYKYNLEKAKAEADKQWREHMDQEFGFKTTITPETRYLEFFDHPDVKRLYAEKTGIKDFYPLGESFYIDGLKLAKKNLPDSAIPAYINVTGERSEASKELTDEEIVEAGRKAYKAIVMPFIALGLSAFFLILNAILAADAFIKRRLLDRMWLAFYDKFFTGRFGLHKIRFSMFNKQIRNRLMVSRLTPIQRESVLSFLRTPAIPIMRTLITNLFLALALVWFVFWPTLQSGGVYDDLEKSKFSTTAKWIYYHESNLAKVYEKLGLSAGMIRANKQNKKDEAARWEEARVELVLLERGEYEGRLVSYEKTLEVRKTLAMSMEDQKEILMTIYKKDMKDLKKGYYRSSKIYDKDELAWRKKKVAEEIERTKKE